MDRNKNFFSSNRIEALSDGIFAIAMTILILNINIPDKETVARIGLHKSLINQANEFYTYFLSFFLLGTFWVIQRRQMSIIIKTDQRHTWLTIFLLMFICLVPFSASLQSDYGKEWVAALVFSGNMLIIGLFFLGTWHYITKNNRLVSKDFNREDIIEGKQRIMLFIIVSIIAMVTGLFIPSYAGLIFLLIPMFKPILRRIK